MMNAFALSGFLTGLTCLAMAGLVYLTNRASRVHQLWALFCLAVALWGFGAMLAGLSDDAPVALVWWRIAHVGVILIPAIFYHFVSAFLGLSRPRRIRVVYLLGAIFWFTNATPLIVAHMRLVFGQFYYNSPPGVLYPLFTAYFAAVIVLGHVDLWQAVRHTTTRQRRMQIAWFAFATSQAFLGGAVCFLPVFGLDVYPYTNFAVPLFPVIMTYAILRYRLMDVSLAVARAMAFLVIYTGVFGVPFVVGLRYQALWQATLGGWWWMAPVGLMGCLASLAPSIYLWIEQRAERRLLREQRRYQATLRHASEGMTQVRQLKRLLNVIVHVVTKTMGVAYAAVFLDEPKEKAFVLRACRHRQRVATTQGIASDDPLVSLLRQSRQVVVLERLQAQLNEARNGQAKANALVIAELERLQASAVVPSFMHDQLIGFLVLGRKRNGQPISTEDAAVLATLANQAAVAIENAQFYEQERQRQAALFHAASLASLGTMVSSMGHQVNNRFNVVSVVSSAEKIKLKELLEKQKVRDPDKLIAALQECMEQFESLQEEALKGGQIVSAIRKIARPSSGDHKPIAVAAAIKAGIDVVQYKVHLDELDFQVVAPDQLPPVLGDLSQLGECFLNLVDNAYDAIKAHEHKLQPAEYHGRIRIEASAASEADGSWIVITVADNGIGITPKEQEYVFVPFFTTKATTEKGTGLGLYVIKKIIEAHHGTITMESTYGLGTRFTIRLPVADPPAHG